MAYAGREIKAFLTLDVSKFNRGLDTAKSKASSLKSDLDGLGNTTNKTSKEMNNAANSTQKAGTNADTAKSKMNGLRNAMNLLKITAGFLAITLGMELAMRIMEVANSAVNAESSIRGMAKGMGWSTSQVTAYLDEMSRLQTIYRKTDMNQVGMEVAKMARIYKLNANEAKDFIETSAVFSSAMAMEGRSARDSALALKDLIDQGQGWERRLSEIGVTSAALQATGLWSGDKSDKKGIIAALNQVLEERSLAQMAKEINNLDDALQVLTIAGGQLLGAFLIPAAPLIYGLTMALADLAYGAKNVVEWLVNVWNGLPGWVQLGIIIGGASIALIAFGGILTSLIIPALAAKSAMLIANTLELFGLAGGLSTAIIAELGFAGALDFAWLSLVAFITGETMATASTLTFTGALWAMTTALLANPITWVVIGLIALAAAVYKVGEYFGWWKDIPTMLEAIKAGVMRLWSAFINNEHVVAIINGIKAAWAGLLQFFAPLIATFQGLWNQIFPPGQKFDIVRGIIDLFGWLGDTVARVWDFFQNNPLGQVLGLLAYFTNPLLFIVLNFNKIVWVVTKAGEAIKAFFGAFYDDSGRFVGLIQGFQNAFGMLWDWLVSVNWGALASAFLNALYMSFKGIGQTIWNTIFGGLSGNMDAGAILANVLNWIIGIFADFNIVTLLVRLLFGDAAATEFSNQIKAFFGPMTSWIGNGLNQLINAAIWLWDVLSPIGSALSWISGLILNGAWDLLLGYWNALVSVGQFLYSIFTAITGAWDTLVGAFFKDGEWQGIIPGLENLGKALWDWIVNIDWIGLSVAFYQGLGSIFEQGVDLAGQILNWFMNIDWIGLFTSIDEWIMQFNPIEMFIQAIFGGDGGGSFLEAIVSWASGIDWYGILMAMFSFIAQYNPLTMIVTLLFGDAAGVIFSNMLMTIFMTAGQGLLIGIQVIMGIINTLSNFVRSVWAGIQSTTTLLWNTVYTTIHNTMIKIWGVVSPYVNKILAAWNRLKTGLVAAAAAVRDGVWGPIKTLWDKLAAFWSFLANPGGGAVSTAKSVAGSVSTSISSRVGGAGFPGAAGTTTPKYKQKVSFPGGAGFFGGIGNAVARKTSSIMSHVIGLSHGGNGAGSKDRAFEPLPDDIVKLFSCQDPEKCSAGWTMPWASSILGLIDSWRTTIFGQSISVSELKQGGMNLFNRLATAIMSGIGYSFYFGDQKSNAEVLASRSCNCYDGAQLLCALASAMGLPCYMQNGFWGSIPHTWPVIGGKVFDTTAFQNRGTWTGPAQGAGFGLVNPVKKVLQFIFNFKGPVYDKDELMKEFREIVHEELNESVDVII
jgi:hypothetical protein